MGLFGRRKQHGSTPDQVPPVDPQRFTRLEEQVSQLSSRLNRRSFAEKMFIPLVVGGVGGLIANVGANIIGEFTADKHDLGVMILFDNGELGAFAIEDTPKDTITHIIDVSNGGDFTETDVELLVQFSSSAPFEMTDEARISVFNDILLNNSERYMTLDDPNLKTFEVQFDRVHPNENTALFFFPPKRVDVFAYVRSYDARAEAQLLATDDDWKGSSSIRINQRI